MIYTGRGKPNLAVVAEILAWMSGEENEDELAPRSEGGESWFPPRKLCPICGKICPRKKYACSAEHYEEWMGRKS